MNTDTLNPAISNGGFASLPVVLEPKSEPEPEPEPQSEPQSQSEAVYSCAECLNLSFQSKEEHRKYIECLSRACGHQLKKGDHCRTWESCQRTNNTHLCRKYAKGYPCPGLESDQPGLHHTAKIHTNRHCNAPNPDTPCQKVHKLSDGSQVSCYQQVEVYHIQKTCQHPLDNNMLCQKYGSKCHSAHDHRSLRGFAEVFRAEASTWNAANASNIVGREVSRSQ